MNIRLSKKSFLAVLGLFLPLICLALKEERTFKASKLPAGSRWNFELRNRTAEAVWLTLSYQDVNIPEVKAILPPAKPYAERYLIKTESQIPVIRVANLELNRPIIVTVNTARSVISNADKLRIAQGGAWRIEPNAQGHQSVFVSLEKGELRPQKGSFGKTQSGLSIEKNVKSKFIERTRQPSSQVGKVFSIEAELEELNEDLQKSGLKELDVQTFKKGIYGFRMGEILSPSSDK